MIKWNTYILLCAKTILSTSHILTYLTFTEIYDGSAIFINPILLMKKLRQSEMKKLTQASRWQSQSPRPGSLTGHLVPNHYSTLPL